MPAARVRLFVTVLMLLTALTLLCSTAWAQYPPTDDTYVSYAAPGTAYGNSGSLSVQGGSKPIYALMKFDLSGLPATAASAQVQKATLKLYLSGVTATGSHGFAVRQVICGPWDETTITYNANPTDTSCHGSSIATSALKISDAADIVGVKAKNEFIVVDITPTVGYWIDNPNLNYGIAILPNDSSISVTFSSKEDTQYSHPAELNIILASCAYSGSGGAPPQAATPTFSPASYSGSAAQTVSISCSTPSSTIYYTRNGSTPTHSSATYSGSYSVTATETDEAICSAAGYSDSAVASATYTINPTSGGPAPTIVSKSAAFGGGNYTQIGAPLAQGDYMFVRADFADNATGYAIVDQSPGGDIFTQIGTTFTSAIIGNPDHNVNAWLGKLQTAGQPVIVVQPASGHGQNLDVIGIHGASSSAPLDGYSQNWGLNGSTGLSLPSITPVTYPDLVVVVIQTWSGGCGKAVPGWTFVSGNSDGSGSYWDCFYSMTTSGPGSVSFSTTLSIASGWEAFMVAFKSTP